MNLAKVGGDQAFDALVAGEMPFDRFAEVTSKHWNRISSWLFKRYELPTWVDEEDVRQDLLIAAWWATNRFDPERGVSFKGYLVFNSIDKAKKRLHKVRGANLHRADRARSRIERPFSAFEVKGSKDLSRRDAGENSIEQVPVEPDHDERVERREKLARARTVCGTVQELLTLRALYETDSLVAAARLLYQDIDARLACRIDDERHAYQVVHRSAAEVAARLQFLSA